MIQALAIMEVAHGKDHHYVAEVQQEIEDEKWTESAPGGTDWRESEDGRASLGASDLASKLHAVHHALPLHYTKRLSWLP